MKDRSNQRFSSFGITQRMRKDVGSLERDGRSGSAEKKISIVIFCFIAMIPPTLLPLGHVELAGDDATVTVAFETETSKARQAFRCRDKAVWDHFVLCLPDGCVLSWGSLRCVVA